MPQDRINFQDIEAAKDVFRGTSKLYKFAENGMMIKPNGHKASLAYSQQHRKIEAAVVAILIKNDPENEKFIVDTREELLGKMSKMIDSITDLSDDELGMTIAYINEDIQITGKDVTKKDRQNWIKYWADAVRCTEKHPEDGPLEQFREKYPEAYKVYDANKEEIEKTAKTRQKAAELEELLCDPKKLIGSDEFWNTSRIIINAEPELVEQIRTAIIRGIKRLPNS